MMKKINKFVFGMVLSASLLALVVGCGDRDREAADSDRQSSLYQSAMNDYNAGRMKEALASFQKVCRREPSNASARFQLACLLQDSAKDFYGALFAYREYLNQRPESDRSHVAKDRMAICEKEVARILAVKYGLTQQETFEREAEHARAEAAASEKTSLKLREDLMTAMRRIAALGKENDRLKAALRNDGAVASESESADQIRSAKALLDADEDVAPPQADKGISEVRRQSEATGDADDRIANSADIDRLRLEGSAERALASSALLPAQPDDARERRAAAEKEEERARAERKRAAAAGRIAHPETYKVAEGDTLYKIALRFYGRTSAWREIRNANRTKISVDGRVKVGDTIRLP